LGGVEGGRLFVSIMAYVLLFECPSTIAYPVQAAEVVEAFVGGSSGMGVSRI
jgi:hypothetical protein